MCMRACVCMCDCLAILSSRSSHRSSKEYGVQKSTILHGVSVVDTSLTAQLCVQHA